MLARHTLPELDEHDLTHLDAYTAATRLVAGGRQTPAFTMKTRPPKPVVGEATAIRQVAAAAITPQDASAIDALVDRLSRGERTGTSTDAGSAVDIASTKGGSRRARKA